MSRSNEKPSTSSKSSSGFKCDPSHLGCKICLDPCASPIYNCRNGHLTCGLCYDKLNPKKCPLKCEGALTPSFLGERLSRELDMKIDCLHSQSGCSTPIKATLLKDHIRTCDYRDMICKFDAPWTAWTPTHNESNVVECNRIIPLWNYRQHVTEVHQVEFFVNDTVSKISIWKKLSNGDPASLQYWRGAEEFDMIPIEYKGRIFHLHTHIRNSFFYWWFTVLGNHKEGETLAVKTRLVTLAGVQLQVQHQFETTLPILPFHGHSDFDPYCGSYGAISGATLSKFYLEDVGTRINPEHNFLIFISIHSTSPSPTMTNTNMNTNRNMVERDLLRLRDRNSEEDREKGRSGSTLQFTVENISQLCSQFTSPRTFVRNLPWRILISPDRDAMNRDTLGFYLQCTGDISIQNWSCHVVAKLKILRSGNRQPFHREISHTFHWKDTCGFGYSNFLLWDTLMNPNKGYVQEDKATFEVEMNADILQVVA